MDEVVKVDELKEKLREIPEITEKYLKVKIRVDDETDEDYDFDDIQIKDKEVILKSSDLTESIKEMREVLIYFYENTKCFCKHRGDASCPVCLAGNNLGKDLALCEKF
jgi:hypothetical protein